MSVVNIIILLIYAVILGITIYSAILTSRLSSQSAISLSYAMYQRFEKIKLENPEVAYLLLTKSECLFNYEKQVEFAHRIKGQSGDDSYPEHYIKERTVAMIIFSELEHTISRRESRTSKKQKEILARFIEYFQNLLLNPRLRYFLEDDKVVEIYYGEFHKKYTEAIEKLTKEEDGEYLEWIGADKGNSGLQRLKNLPETLFEESNST